MVTGDHPQTAVAIGREIGLFAGADPVILTGDQVGRMSEAQMWAALEAPHVVFARVGADQKLRIVTSLQRRQTVVAAQAMVSTTHRPCAPQTSASPWG
jgi:magnesium-transporting ATPase (P-type)